jgi:hypothetical protein
MCVTDDQTGVRPGETVTNGPLGSGLICGYFAVCMTRPESTTQVSLELTSVKDGAMYYRHVSN